MTGVQLADRRPRSRRASQQDGPGVPARRAALRLLDAVLRRGQALEAALDTAARELDQANDRALAHAIAAEVLRRLPDLDALIDSATARPLPGDAKARVALRIALAQALMLGTPPHAAISTVLPLVDGGPRKLVHGVFGTLMRRGATLPAVPTLPEAVAERWRTAWGGDMVAAAARAIAAPPPLDLTLKNDDAPADLGGVALIPGHRRLADHAPVPQLPGYAEGAWWVQDIAASLPARLIGAGPGRAIDLCAAPGGKTLQLAAAGWQVAAVDISESRLARLSDNLARTGLAAEVIARDALDWAPPAPVDAVLLDAPCSATGIFRRHPDVLHRVSPALIEDAAVLQERLLARAVDWLRPGGTLVYATCSLEPAEGEAQIDRLLASRSDFAIDPVRAEELPVGISAAPQGWLRLLPGTIEADGGCDGFFIARLRRAA
ncbi:RsmB/NOP family class I SAM-dependent RNA methyltransferase [Hephaestia mangrovi]|uniref:RsmB/NOP family class I SAM-dependent RNA methyltransferase n=1 Tax=Hephaestia mangrovi TaxID=2873268 RepID=UPI001CA6BE70|nr:transcription antitermination factor NusB [Hephaestia mangrovi]MBY8829040.1 SAM-dependent methyltransferase [Hephaestia mangrovi]